MAFGKISKHTENADDSHVKHYKSCFACFHQTAKQYTTEKNA